jgi:co-chaperonin GroES (HSP10)
MSNLKPSFGRVILKNIQVEQASSIVLTVKFDDESAKYLRAEVIKASDGYYTLNGTWIPSQFKPGNIVWYYRYNSASIPAGKETYVAVSESDIIAVEE